MTQIYPQSIKAIARRSARPARTLHLPVYALGGFLTDVLDKEGIGVVALEVDISCRLVFTDHKCGLHVSFTSVGKPVSLHRRSR